MFKKSILVGSVIFITISWLPIPIRSQSDVTDYQAITAKEPSIPTRELELTIKPLTKQELEIEASAWLELLKVKVEEVSNAEIAVERKNQEVDSAKTAVNQLEEAQEALTEAKETNQESSTPVTTEDKQENIEEVQKKVEEAQKSVEEAVEEEQKTQQNQDVQESLTEAKQDAVEVEKETESSNNNDQQIKKPLQENIDQNIEQVPAVNPTNLADEKTLNQANEKIQNTAENLESAIEDKKEIKTQLLLNLTEARDEQTIIGERFQIIVDELDKKGGDVEEYRKYLSAVSLVEVDVTDNQSLWITILGWLKSEEGGRRWAINIGKFLAITLFSILASFVAANVTRRSLQMIPNMSELLRGFLVGIVRQGTLVIGILLALTALEISLGPLLTVFGGVSFVLAFALQSNLGNLASGLMIMFYKPFDEGDEIKVDELWGYVDSITIANTKIRGWSGEIISVPNDSIWTSNIVNLTHSEYRGFTGTIALDIEENIGRAKEVILDAIKSHPLVVNEPAPRTLVWELDGDAVNLMFFGHTKTQEYWDVYGEVIELIQQAINREKIAIDLPEQVIKIESISNVRELKQMLPSQSLEKMS